MSKNEYNKKLLINLIVGIGLFVIGLTMAIIGFIGFSRMLALPEESRSMVRTIVFFFLGFLGLPPFFIGMFKSINNGFTLARSKTDEKDAVVAEKDREVLQETILATHYDSLDKVDYSKELTVVPNHGPVSGDTGPKNKVLAQVFNVFWIIFVGIWSAISNAIIGVGLCITIVGIPAGISCFKIIPLVFHPAGREVRLHYGDHKFWNTVNIIFGGFEAYLVYNVYAFLLCATIIGIPLGLQFFKIAKFYLAPYGSETVIMNTYSQNRNHYTDLRIFYDQLMEENRPVKLSDGSIVSATDAMKVILTSEEKHKLNAVSYSNQKTIVESICSAIMTMIVAAAIVFGVTLLIFVLTKQQNISSALIVLYFVGGIGVFIAIIFGVIFAIMFNNVRAPEMEVFKKKLINISTYYPQQSKPNSQKLSERRRRGYKIGSILMDIKRG